MSFYVTSHVVLDAPNNVKSIWIPSEALTSIENMWKSQEKNAQLITLDL